MISLGALGKLAGIVNCDCAKRVDVEEKILILESHEKV